MEDGDDGVTGCRMKMSVVAAFSQILTSSGVDAETVVADAWRLERTRTVQS
ncbi:hypothetical protein DEO72_LG5g2133 [Vigna unguiculata]|uniref:Uncharacterized protein n=1 Tax=Vigna unguiculata TaxID=3917 RepID=A0A4D6LZ57_VIGUN|nr:hypothetical protein DEO72_LG5g2132 [Vigna unguiculata]QCD94055.1 hypothetical protein DEO72_LG5g2133 [Vigna unguiculata]